MTKKKPVQVDNKWGMNESQRNFCDYYIQTRNARQAYKRAYGIDKEKVVKDTSASTNAYKLLQQPNIQDYIKEKMREIKVDKHLEEEEILMELTKMALNSANTPTSRIKALELLGKSKALWVDKTEGDNDMDVVINLTGIKEELEGLDGK